MTSPAVAQPTPSSSKALPAEEGGDGGNRQVENVKKPPTSAFLTPEITSYFIGELRALSRTNDHADRRGLWGAAGGCAGAASRTVVSPLERLKIIQCVRLDLIHDTQR